MALPLIKQLLGCYLLLFIVSSFGIHAASSCANETTINGQPFPSLIDVTTEDLISGLERGLFTSVDLVNVCLSGIALINHSANGRVGISCSDLGGQWHASYGHRDKPRCCVDRSIA